MELDCIFSHLIIRASLDGVWFTCLFISVLFTISTPFVVWGANSLFPSYYTEIWETKYDSQDLLSDDKKNKKKDLKKDINTNNGAEKTNIMKSELYTEEEVYSDESKSRSFFVDKINEFSVNQIATPKKSSVSFLGNSGNARLSFSSEKSRTSNITTENQTVKNDELVQIIEGGSNDGLNQMEAGGISHPESYSTVIKLQSGLTPHQLEEAVKSIHSLVEIDVGGPNEHLTFEYIEPVPAIQTKDNSKIQVQDDLNEVIVEAKLSDAGTVDQPQPVSTQSFKDLEHIYNQSAPEEYPETAPLIPDADKNLEPIYNQSPPEEYPETAPMIPDADNFDGSGNAESLNEEPMDDTKGDENFGF